MLLDRAPENEVLILPKFVDHARALVRQRVHVGLDEDGDGKAEGLGDSTLLKLVNKGDLIAAAKEFPKWNKVGGKVSPGLVRRRAAEKFYFETGKLHFMLPGLVS